jgi:hypothetical protein
VSDKSFHRQQHDISKSKGNKKKGMSECILLSKLPAGGMMGVFSFRDLGEETNLQGPTGVLADVLEGQGKRERERKCLEHKAEGVLRGPHT